jgi:hypothetical protein
MLKRKNLIILAIILLILIIIFLINKSPTGKSIQQIEIVSLPEYQKQKIENILSSNEFIKDFPQKYPVLIRFFSFQNGERIWHDAFLIGENKKPIVYLSLNAKYIDEMNERNVCEIVGKANKKGDLGFYSDYNKASLFLKYSSMLKYRKCFES